MSKYKTTFLDYPLDEDLYVSRPYVHTRRPIRVLITDAGQKFVYCLIYKICTGAVFGENQEVYIHLVNAKGVIDHKCMFLELEECGFHILKGWVVTSNVEEAYNDVDVIVLTTSFEERSGITHKESIVSQLIKGRHMMRHIVSYCKPSVKVVLTGCSTKLLLLQMYLYHRLEPKFPTENMSAVTLLDEAIARANLAARLKTTTNKIKNIVIWGMTCPDVCNATVRMLPPGDLGALEEVDVPVHEALKDDNYLHDEFVQCIFRRKIGNEFSRSGKSMAIATCRHLRALFLGAPDSEIISMGVITPSSEPYMIPQGISFSFPVTVTGNGSWKIRENVKYDIRTHLNLMRTTHRLLTDKTMLSIEKMLEYILDFEEKTEDMIRINQKEELTELFEISEWDMRYYQAPLPIEAIPKTNREKIKTRKSIAWDDGQGAKKRDQFQRRSSIRFTSDEVKKQERKSSILKHSDTGENLVLPSINKTND